MDLFSASSHKQARVALALAARLGSKAPLTLGTLRILNGASDGAKHHHMPVADDCGASGSVTSP